MPSNFRIKKPFDEKPPRLKDLVNSYVMGDVWVRDTPFGPVTDSLVMATKFEIRHASVLRAVATCRKELGSVKKFELENHLIENTYKAGAEGRKRLELKVDITEFGLALLLLYINTPKARQISAEILYRFFVLQTYVKGLNDRQIGALKGYYRQQMKEG